MVLFIKLFSHIFIFINMLYFPNRLQVKIILFIGVSFRLIDIDARELLIIVNISSKKSILFSMFKSNKLSPFDNIFFIIINRMIKYIEIPLTIRKLTEKQLIFIKFQYFFSECRKLVFCYLEINNTTFISIRAFHWIN